MMRQLSFIESILPKMQECSQCVHGFSAPKLDCCLLEGCVAFLRKKTKRMHRCPGHWKWEGLVGCRLSFCHPVTPVPHPCVKIVFVVIPFCLQRLLIRSHPNACFSPHIHYMSLQTCCMASPYFSACILFVFIKRAHKLILVQQFPPAPSFSDAEIPKLC